MSIRVYASALKSAVAIVGVIAGSGTLAGCTSLGSRTFGDPVTTGSTAMVAQGNMNQPMPASLGAPTQTAMNEFLPPENVGGLGTQPILGQTQPMQTQALAPLPPVGGSSPTTVSTASLPPLGSTQTLGTPTTMPAPSTLAPMSAAAPSTLAPPPQTLSSANSNGSGNTHVIQSGESLYTIARQYNVTTQSLVQANNLASPDRITVGQSIIIPGRPGAVSQPSAQPMQQVQPLPTQQASTQTLPTQPAPTQQVAATTQPSQVTPMMPPAHTTTPATQPTAVQQTTTPPATTPPASAPTQQVATTTQPTQQPAAPVQQQAAASDDFRWPVSGRVITDFAASRGTGINIEVPEGTTVRAAETGTVIYVGSGVEGYGNLILVRHSNGYVSAYAHLKSMSVEKGATVSRGDAIGQSGQTGSVNRPQLHFELRRGATPVDPIPLLAG